MKKRRWLLIFVAAIFLGALGYLNRAPEDLGDNAAGRVLTMTDQGQVVFKEAAANGQEGTTVQAPSSLASNLTFTLPPTQGTNGQFLQTTDSSGTLAWGNSGAASLDSAYANGATIAMGANTITLNSITNATLLKLSQTGGGITTPALDISYTGTGPALVVSLGNTSLNGNLAVVGTSSFNSPITSPLTLSSTLQVQGGTTFNADATFSSANKLLFQSDTNLYRAAAGILQTDHSLRIKGGDPWFDILAFGATNNGTADDDTAALQAALDAAEVNGGAVFVPRGTFYINQGRLEYLSLKALTIFGTGWESKLLWNPATDTPPNPPGNYGMINIHGTGNADANHCTRVVVRDLAIDFGGSRAAPHQEFKRGLNIYNSDNVEVTGCYLKGCLHETLGIGNFGSPDTPGNRAYIAGNYFFDGSQDGLNPNNLSSTIIGNYFRQMDTGIEAGRKHLIISDNHFDDIEGSAIKISSVDSFTVTGNRIIDSPTLNAGFVQGAIYVVGGGSIEASRYGVISGNTVFENAAVTNQIGIATGLGTSITAPEDILISHNNVRGATLGIYVNRGFKVQVLNNYVVGGTGCSTGISLGDTADTDNCLVTGNHVVDTWSTATYGTLPTLGANNMQYNNHDALGLIDLQFAANHGSAPGTKIKRHLSATASLNFGSISEGVTSSLTITVTGAAVGDTVAVGPGTGWDAGNLFNHSARVSAADTVRIVVENTDAAPTDPDGSGVTWRADVWGH
jgi:parallel beta helix pectate lyase-like protein